MAGTFYPVYSGNQLVVYVLLKDMANTGRFKANPTIATGDFKYSADGGAANNVDAQAVQTDNYWVKLTINAGNAVGDYLLIRCVDQTSPPEWADFGFAVPTHLANIPANVTQWLGQAVQAAVNGFPKVDLTYIFGTILSESAGAGALAGAFIKFFNKTSPTGTINSLPDAVPNAAGGLLITTAGSLDMDDIGADVDAIETRVTTALPNAAPQAAGGLVTSAAGALDFDDLAADVDATETRVILALPNAAPQAAGGLITSIAGSLDLDEMNADVEAIETRVTTALPNAAPQAAGGLITSIAGSLDLDEMNADIEAIQTGVAALPTLDQIGDEVWDETLADHLSAGSTGAALNSAGSLTDPWATVLPDGYGTGQAGNLLAGFISTNDGGVIISTDVQDRSTTLGVKPYNQDEATFSNTIAANTATRVWESDPADFNDPDTMGEIMNMLDVDAPAIKAKTDNLPASPAAVGDIPTAIQNADVLLKRDWTAITGEASRSLLNAGRFIRNHFSTTAHAGKVTVYKEDDTTEAYQKTLTTDPSAEPIVEG